MNQYSPSSESRVGTEGHVQESISDPADHPFYAVVLKMVLWGEDRDEILHRFEINGIPSDLGEILYQHARKDRVSTIRGGYSRKLITGICMVLAAAIVFAVCWFGFGGIPRILLYPVFAVLGIGAWKSIDGLAGYLMAPTKTGSVADDF